MKYNTIELKVPYFEAGLFSEGCAPVLVEYVAHQSPEIGRKNRPAVLIIPGGGYDWVSDREGEPVAFALLAKGIQCYVLKYSCVKKSFPLDLLEAACALAYIREHAVENDINPEDITVLGFSAGGHLAASLAVHWNRSFVKAPLGFFKGEHRPNALALSYPVISATDTHQGSIDNLMCTDSYLTTNEGLGSHVFDSSRLSGSEDDTRWSGAFVSEEKSSMSHDISGQPQESKIAAGCNADKEVKFQTEAASLAEKPAETVTSGILSAGNAVMVGLMSEEERRNLVSLEKNVSPDTPKAFIWHCSDDGCVPVSNSLRFASALNEHHIPFVLHVYQNGGHGGSLCDEVTAKEQSQINEDAAGWVKLFTDWIYRRNLNE